jgi:chromosomal replication initiation ATPase DnaA
MVAAYLARMLTHESYPTIAEALGGQHHSTVINSVHRARALMAENEAMLDAVVGMALVVTMITRRRHDLAVL